MKVAFNRREENPTIGPYIFLERLISYLENTNRVQVVRNPGRYHQIHFINISGSGRKADQWKAKKILRIDGIYHDLNLNSNERNESIRSTYHDADGVVFQCNFSRQMLYKHFGKPAKARAETIIYNGVDSSFCPEGKSVNFGFKHSLVMSGKLSWPSKRLAETIEALLSLDRSDLGLIVLGEVKDKVKDPRIKYCGFIDPKDLPAFYRGVDIMLHLAYTDWCPNVVVEALSCGVPVITTHNGGVPELVQGSGVIIKNDPDYDMEFVDFRKLPKISPMLLSEAIDMIIENREQFVVPRPDLSIEHCGKQYVEFFERVLE